MIGEVEGVLSGGGTFILGEKFTSPGIFPRGGIFSLYIYLIFPTQTWQPFLLSNIAAEYFPVEGSLPSTFPSFSLIFPTHSWQPFFLSNITTKYFPREGHFPSSELATLQNSTMAPEGRESRDLGSGGEILFLAKRLPPLEHTPPLTTYVTLSIVLNLTTMI